MNLSQMGTWWDCGQRKQTPEGAASDSAEGLSGLHIINIDEGRGGLLR